MPVIDGGGEKVSIMAANETASDLLDSIGRAIEQANEALEAQREAEPPLPPTTADFCLNVPLYAPIRLIEERDKDWLLALKFRPHQFDAYCIYCGRDVPFRSVNRQALPDDIERSKNLSSFSATTKQNVVRLTFADEQFGLHMACQRKGHTYSYYFATLDGAVVKIGQIPSLEDVVGADLEKYRKILGKDFTELRKAGGLISHGIGIGAFVYLRRIFERLIEDARAEADPNGDNREDFYRMRMTERIDALRSVLPPSVVEYKGAYGILSKGLHELSEEECNQHFPVLRAAIIAMLEERYEVAARKKAAEALKAAVAAAAAEMK